MVLLGKKPSWKLISPQRKASDLLLVKTEARQCRLPERGEPGNEAGSRTSPGKIARISTPLRPVGLRGDPFQELLLGIIRGGAFLQDDRDSGGSIPASSIMS